MKNQFQARIANRKQVFMKIGLCGVSGSGKTYSALLLAHGMVGDWSKIYLADTENGSGELYSHLGAYNVIPFKPPFSPENYIRLIEYVQTLDPGVLIIDSGSHEWDGKGGILELVDHLKKTSKNQFAVWSEATPKHNLFIQSILQVPLHVIITFRSKTKWEISEDKKPVKLGQGLIQRDGFEYELTINFEVSENHFAVASKDRTGLFADGTPFQISKETGKKISEWNNQGVPKNGYPIPTELDLMLKDIKEESQGLSVGELFPSLYDDFKKEYEVGKTSNEWKRCFELSEKLYSSIIDYNNSNQADEDSSEEISDNPLLGDSPSEKKSQSKNLRVVGG